RQHVRKITGNPVEVIEADGAEAARKLSSKSPLWRDIAREGVVVLGATIEKLQGARG
ncbi:MAG: hypothetical protein ACI9C1_002852, partial [Candidatus Aldehydirespiratoraceae bacterium]